MKNKFLLIVVTILTLFAFPKVNFGQLAAPTLGTAADFALFSSAGAVTSTSTLLYLTHVTGDIGAAPASITGFGNVDGVLYQGGTEFNDGTVDIQNAYTEMNGLSIDFVHASPTGGGLILTTGVHQIVNAAIQLTGDLILDAENVPGAVFVLIMDGDFNTSPNSRVILLNGAQACNVFWKVEGVVTMGTNTQMKGTIIANQAAINMSAGDTLEGRALSLNGAITINEAVIYMPQGCSSPILTGPIAPVLASSECFGLFAAVGPVTDNLSSFIDGDVGTNGSSDLTTGFDPLKVTGDIHPIPDGITAQAATDLNVAYLYLGGLVEDIILLEPTLFGHDLVLTPHVYLLGGAVTFTDTVSLNAQGNPDAVFVIQVAGAFNAGANSNVKLINGTQAKNVYWLIDGAVDIGVNSIFNGTMIVAGAIDLQTGVQFNGRALTIGGALSTASIELVMPTTCAPTTVSEPTDIIACAGDSISFVVDVTGTGLTFQWRNGTVDLVDGGNISGATNDTLTFNPVFLSDSSSNYNLVIIGDYSPNDTTFSVSLTVDSAAVILTQPSDQTACAGDSVSFVVEVEGTNVTYQWRNGLVDLIDGSGISGVNNDTLTFNPVNVSDTSSNYNVIITGTCPPDVTSQFVSLTVDSAGTIDTQPIDQTACSGDSVSFVVEATGVNLVYQWRNGLVNLINGSGISGVDNDTLTFNPVFLSDTSVSYNVVITGNCASATSDFVSLEVDSISSITTEPIDQTVCTGDSVSFVVEASGFGLNYQWRNGLVNLINGSGISGVDNDTLTFNPVFISDTSSNYNVVISGACTPDITSLSASLIVDTTAIILIEPINQNACAGDSVSFVVNAVGTGITYQWRNGITNLSNGNGISGVDNDTLTFNPVNMSDASLNYNVVVSGTCLPSVNSQSASLTVDTSAVITTSPTDQVVCAGSSAGFTVVATGTGLNYQWRRGTDNLSDDLFISGSSTSSLIINPTSITNTDNDYNVVVTGTCLPSVTSVNVSLTVNPTPVANTSSNSPICTDDNIELSALTVSGASYLWVGPGTYTSSDQNPIIVAATSANSGVYTLTTEIGNCTSTPSSVTVTVSDCTTDLGVTKTVNIAEPIVGTTVVFTIVATNSGTSAATGVVVTDILKSGYTLVSSNATVGVYESSTGNWSIGTLGIDASETLTITATVNASGEYANTATITGNETEDILTNNTSTVETFPTDFYIPEGFSPNGDGINDVLVIRGIGNYPDNSITIFNRWGNKVFEASPYLNDWAGNATSGIIIRGDELPVGTYFYVLDLGDGTPMIKGTFYLNR